MEWYSAQLWQNCSWIKDVIVVYKQLSKSYLKRESKLYILHREQLREEQEYIADPN